MNIDTTGIEYIVKKVMAEIDCAEESGRTLKDGELGVFNDMQNAIDAAYIAQKSYMRQTLAFRSKLIAAMRAEMLKKENMETICHMAVEETGMGNYEHKLIKHQLAINKTPGVEDLVAEAWTGDNGLTLNEQSPFGVIGASTPSTNPSETVINNSIGMLAGGNTVVFAPHPSAKQTNALCVKLLNKAILEAGGPENLIVTTANPTLESANLVFSSDKITMLCATGGPGVVKAVLQSGKKGIGAGAGNPPALVDETADIEKAAKDIVDGCCFDNNLPCIAEKEVVVVDQVADYLIFNMKKNGAYELKDAKKIEELAELVYPNGRLSRDYVGRDAITILKGIGIEVDSSVRVVMMETSKDHIFAVEELMMPILPIVRVKDIEEGIEVAVNLEHGNRHTAIMHSTNVNNLSEMAKRVQCTIFVKNAPSYAGIGVGGEGYTTFTIAGPTGEGLTSAKTFTRKRRCTLVGGFDIK
ncbi:aldehyde dehydrogenase family protein [Acetobacterium paludosum]|uniref:Aldehyde dehydrogenase family protein n=1 Tax=Acetobacterium paludosum TaxID=52693 RepID=A0A923HZ87_9FIRM|nr:aldehyde dehydrogenase family protein [Acetobacterium paludosum]MBC3887278.1 aldehyde dehydrogenase family protein [Acetobacterium paludosum]